MPINLFIDTNIFLSFFHLTKDDLEELKKLSVLLTKGEIRLYLPEQVVAEFRRNREGKIADAMKTVREQRLNLQFPQICKNYPEYPQLRKLQRRYEVAHNELLEKLGDDIESGNLKADQLIKKLFKRGESIATTDDLVKRGRLRMDLGHPPGKGESLGDAINWEALLDKVPDGKHLHFVTDDKDYASPLEQANFNGFLLREWDDKKSSKLIYYKRLSEFFKDRFPTIELASEVEKDLLITQLANSGAFDETHRIIAKLNKYADFTAAQADAIVSAAVSNSQIHWIISDSDVKGFLEAAIKGKKGQIDQRNLKMLQKILSPD